MIRTPISAPGVSRDRVHALGDDPQRVDVEARVGLVENRQSRLLQRELQDLHALLLAAREAVVEVAAGELLGNLGQLHRGLDGLAEVLQRDRLLVARGAMSVQDRAQVLGDGHARHRDRVLESHEQPQARPLIWVAPR